MPNQETALFVWEGLDRNGSRTRGEISARSEITARAELRRQGIRVVKIKKKPKPLFGGPHKKITPKHIAVFSRQLATMLSAGVPLVQAFDIVGRGHDNPAMQDLLMSIKADVEAGTTLADALSKHPVYFDELFCNLVRAGEQAGVLETLLHKVADYKEKTEFLKGKIKKALAYPIAVVVVAVIVTSILLIFVVPTFEDLFKSFGADLPAFTQMVINLSRWLRDWWYVVFGSLGVATAAFVKARQRSPAFNHLLDRLALGLPVVGAILHKAAIARFARTLSTMSAAGVPLVEALQSVAGATGNIIYGDVVMRMREEVSIGQQLQMSMRQANLFPNMVVQMVAIGEESGALDSMLSKVADFYEEEVDNAVDSLSSLLEPLIMVVLGILVGGLVIAMYLPIFKLGSVV
ncbi:MULTISPECIES: type II secretion system F family protein [Methylococcus]|uniref:Type II secretion system F family protein n=1 Tax=Methylococcus capsulatus TaxID=414 RepID=A0ABZ2F467_METCP|nr:MULTISPECIES: type II secretion system F family protein [Methylococcus]MDF9392494.1 type II secretion system F family protein [Methylococcus capsulatus]